MTEPEIDALCLKAGRAAIGAVQTAADGTPEELHHIVTFAAASSLLGLAARVLVKHEFGGIPELTDHRVVALIQGWGQALRFYPDQRALNDAMTQVREDLVERTRIRGLVEMIASCTDPAKGSIDAELEAWSKTIKTAKLIVGDLSDEDEDDGE